MNKRLPIGISDFKEIVEDGYYFIDKSLLIKDVIDNAKIALVTRPRRFGKTMNLSMLRYFYSNEADFSHLFQSLAISREEERYQSGQNKHPVIFFSLKDIKAETWAEAYRQLVYLVRDTLSKNFSYIFNSDDLTFLEKEQFDAIQKGETDLIYYSSVLKALSSALQ